MDAVDPNDSTDGSDGDDDPDDSRGGAEGTCYFKSTDGHCNNWSFSGTRLKPTTCNPELLTLNAEPLDLNPKP